MATAKVLSMLGHTKLKLLEGNNVFGPFLFREICIVRIGYRFDIQSVVGFIMKGSETVSLENNEFTANISKTLQDIRISQEFTDVTLACEDDQLEAHRVVLSSGSQFFQRIFTRYSSSSKTLVIMRGVKKAQMMPILDFLYCGEVSVLEDHLEDFLFVANDLGLKGLAFDNDQNNESIVHEKKFGHGEKRNDIDKGPSKIYEDGEVSGKENTGFEEIRSKLPKAFKMTEKSLDTLSSSDDTKLTEDDQESVMEKVAGVWSCKVCGKTTGIQKGHLREHVRIHMQPTKISCKLCGKMFKNRFNEDRHIKTCSLSRFQENSLFILKTETK